MPCSPEQRRQGLEKVSYLGSQRAFLPWHDPEILELHGIDLMVYKRHTLFKGAPRDPHKKAKLNQIVV